MPTFGGALLLRRVRRQLAECPLVQGRLLVDEHVWTEQNCCRASWLVVEHMYMCSTDIHDYLLVTTGVCMYTSN